MNQLVGSFNYLQELLLNMVDSIRTILARLEERLGNLSDNNKETHEKICTKLDNLTEHVNHREEIMDARVKLLETDRIKIHSYWKVIFTCVGGSAGISVLIMKLLGLL